MLPSLNKVYCIVLYCIVLYCIVLYCIVLYCIVLWRKDPGRNWSRDLLKSNRFLIDDDDVDIYTLIYNLHFVLQV